MGNIAERGIKYGRVQDALRYLILSMATFFALSALFVIIHEHIHSTTAYLLGHKQSPFDIVWGNPLTLAGWDEGVDYSSLFASGEGVDAALIALSPLLFQSGVVIVGLYLLLSDRLLHKKWSSHLLFWLVVVNFMELFAYIGMRAFAPDGDIGNINHGLGLNPWILFLPGMALIAIGLYVIFARVLPRMYVVVAEGSRMTEYVLLVSSTFLLLIYGSGLRVVLYIYPDPQWLFGLEGFVLFGVVVYLCRPGMPWVVRAKERAAEKMGEAKTRPEAPARSSPRG